MKRIIARIAGLMLAVLMLLGTTTGALAASTTVPEVIGAGTYDFTYTLDFNNTLDFTQATNKYASAQFDIKITNSDDKAGVALSGVSYTAGITPKASPVLSKATASGNVTMYTAGFVSSENNFGGESAICTVTFKYAGTTAATVEFSNLKLVRFVNTASKTAAMEQTFTGDAWSRTLSISRGTVTPTGGGGTGAPSSGSGGVAGTKTYNFDDVHESDWFYPAVQYVAGAEIITGTTSATFEPRTPISRAMFVTILYRLAGSPAVTGTSAFTDVTAGQWYTNAVLWANQNGIVTGYDSKTFGTNDALTREQLVTMLYRYASLMKYDVTAGQNDDLHAFTDVKLIDSYALTAFKWANAAGIVHGTTPTTLSPLSTSSRAEGAQIMMSFMGKYK